MKMLLTKTSNGAAYCVVHANGKATYTSVVRGVEREHSCRRAAEDAVRRAGGVADIRHGMNIVPREPRTYNRPVHV